MRLFDVLPRFAALALLLASPVAMAASDPLAPLDFLVGQWTAPAPAEKNAPNRGGTSEIGRELGGMVLVRHDRTMLRDGGSIDMLMVIYPDRSGLRADFFDSDHHVIHYAVSDLQIGKSVQFTSEGPANAPAFRLTYEKKAEHLLVRFEIAPPGPQRSFKTYAEGLMNRQ